jgi:hypothetical protein
MYPVHIVDQIYPLLNELEKRILIRLYLRLEAILILIILFVVLFLVCDYKIT